MNKTIKREKLVANFNQQIANCKSPERRITLKEIYNNILIDMGCYEGFQYIDWVNGGFAEWQLAGHPADNVKYLGDQSKIEFI